MKAKKKTKTYFFNIYMSGGEKQLQIRSHSNSIVLLVHALIIWWGQFIGSGSSRNKNSLRMICWSVSCFRWSCKTTSTIAIRGGIPRVSVYSWIWWWQVRHKNGICRGLLWKYVCWWYPSAITIRICSVCRRRCCVPGTMWRRVWWWILYTSCMSCS